MNRTKLFWPIWIFVSGLLCSLLFLFAPGTPLNMLAALLFLLISPGMALVPLLQLSDWMNELMLGIALSLTLDALIAAAALYAGLWHPGGVLGLLIGLSWLGAGLQVWQVGHPTNQRLRDRRSDAG